ncbi:hypothetical protein BD413DRAFT_596913 [Trametes elegans]|nr:hypothetical protein BD413DRAFT_596913 [Trametes elegans]
MLKMQRDPQPEGIHICSSSLRGLEALYCAGKRGRDSKVLISNIIASRECFCNRVFLEAMSIPRSLSSTMARNTGSLVDGLYNQNICPELCLAYADQTRAGLKALAAQLKCSIAYVDLCIYNRILWTSSIIPLNSSSSFIWGNVRLISWQKPWKFRMRENNLMGLARVARVVGDDYRDIVWSDLIEHWLDYFLGYVSTCVAYP